MAAFGEAIRRYQASVDDFDRTVARLLGVNATDARCLELLLFDHPGGATPATLGVELGLTSGSVTTMTDRLVRAGLVRRREHPTDRRTVLVTATPLASTRSEELHRSLVERGNMLLADYPPRQIEAMTDFLQRAAELQRDEEARLRRAGEPPR